MKETEFQKQVVKKLKSVGALILNIHGHMYQALGWPDLQVYHPVWTGHLELKVGLREPTSIQKIMMKQLYDRGVKVYTLRWTQGIIQLLNKDMSIVAAKKWKELDGRGLMEFLLGADERCKPT